MLIRLNIHEAKTHLSRYLKRLARGDVILICKRNVPLAELRGISPPRDRERPVGLAKGELSVPASFFEPLPERVVEEFEGR